MNDRFPTFRIEGGPHGHNTKTYVDDVLQRGVTRVEFVADVNDAIRVKTFQIGVVNVHVQIKHGYVAHVARVDVRLNSEDGLSYEVVAEAEADTLWQAVMDCALQLQLREKHEQTSSTGDTVDAHTSEPAEGS